MQPKEKKCSQRDSGENEGFVYEKLDLKCLRRSPREGQRSEDLGGIIIE